MTTRISPTAPTLAPSTYGAALAQLHAQVAIAAGGTLAPDQYVPAAPVMPVTPALAPQAIDLEGLRQGALKLWGSLRDTVVRLVASAAPSTPAASPTPTASGPTVRKGDDGAAVLSVQRRLQELGFDPGAVDGDFGAQTEAAVKAFQRARGLDADGIVGPETWAKLGAQAPVTPTPNPGSLGKVSPAQLAEWGAHDKQKFFAALRPGAEAAEKKYGVPAAVTLAQAALESGWGKHGIGGYNIFGIKGTGPAGTKAIPTQEWEHGRYVTITANFALYHDYDEAVELHGKLFHNGYYKKAINAYKSDPSPFTFVKNIQGIYATDPQYSQKITSIIKTYGLA